MNWDPETHASSEVRAEIRRIDTLGQRIVHDKAEIMQKRLEADRLEARALILRREASEIERLLELARHSQ